MEFSRLKMIVKDINKIWSLVLAYVNSLAKHNRDVKYLLLAVDCLSRYKSFVGGNLSYNQVINLG